jgi:hypothetical protein
MRIICVQEIDGRSTGLLSTLFAGSVDVAAIGP